MMTGKDIGASAPLGASPSPLGAQDDQFFPIYVGSLGLDTVVGFDLFLRNRPGRPPVLYRAKDLPMSQEVLDRLEEHNVATLYVDVGQQAQYRCYVEDNLQSILADDNLDMSEKSKILYGSAQELVREVMTEPRAGEVVSRSKNLVNNTVQFLFSKQDAFENLLKVTSYDYYTYTHSVNVFVFSVSLAQRLGFDDIPTMLEFGVGALLHDIGKSMIDPAIVRCRTGLSPAQWDEMRKHPHYGIEILKDHGHLSDLSLDIVLHHHEKMDGSGYPDGLDQGKLSTFARISTVADIFDALTTERSYKNALESFPALTLMRNEMQSELDRDIFRALIAMMGNP